jgi:membrane-associated phospholipid phosphatase
VNLRSVSLILGFICLIFLSNSSNAQTFLRYDSANFSEETELALPVSSYHDWSQAQSEAQAIQQSWQRGEQASLAWTRLMLGRHIKHKTMPTRGARGLAIVHLAMHDAYQLAVQRKMNHASARLAMSMAGAECLSYLYVAEEKAFFRVALALAALESKTTREQLDKDALMALNLGRQVAAQVIQRAQSDGAQRGWNGARLQYYGQDRFYGLGSWEPTPPYFYYPPDEPFAPQWKPWVLSSGAQFRLSPPPFASDQYFLALKEVVKINREILATTPSLSASEIAAGTLATPSDPRYAIAKFWVAGHGSVTPPGHWNQIAMEELKAEKMTDLQALKLFATLNVGLADTFIAIWDAKYHSWTMRPITAAKILLGVQLKPLVLTPPFPSYPSGHAGFSACAAKILAHYFPKRQQALLALAKVAADSRLYGGIHFRFENDDGATIGSNVATEVLKRMQ